MYRDRRFSQMMFSLDVAPCTGRRPGTIPSVHGKILNLNPTIPQLTPTSPYTTKTPLEEVSSEKGSCL